MRVRSFFIGLCIALSSLASLVLAQERGPVVLAAASLQESLTDAANAWTAKGHTAPVLSFGGSSALARQIGAKAPADLFLSADEAWMQDVAKKGLVRAGTRVSFLSNRLVLVAPSSSRLFLQVGAHFPLAETLKKGRLSLADPEAVPAGKYAKAALMSLGVWRSVSGKIARAENVRAALALVERGEAPLGVVYATDALASKNVRVVGTFPENSHPPITYPLAVLNSSTHKDAEKFRRFLLSPEGRRIFTKYGFGTR